MSATTGPAQARLWLDSAPEPPYSGSLGVLGAYFRRALSELGYDTSCSVLPEPTPLRRLLPLPAAVTAGTSASSSGGLQLFFDRCLEYLQPDARGGSENIVVFHGLRYGAPFFLRGRGLSGYCANSDFLRRVLLSLLLLPDLEHEGAPVFQGDAVVGAVRWVLPWTDFPDGYPSTGASLPVSVARRCEGVLLAHALRPGKLIPETTAAILGHLNQEPLRGQLAAPVHLLAAESDVPRIAQAGQRLFGDDRLSALLISVPWLTNPELMALMKKCHFGLLFDWVPESFGFYPLESVCCGVPIFSNGAGNVRFLLPEGHGIRILSPSTPPQAPAGPPGSPYQAVAAEIAADLQRGQSTSECVKGRAWIQAHHRYEHFRESLKQFLHAVHDRERLPAAPIEELVMGPGPLVRRWSPEPPVAVTDMGDTRLSPLQLELMERARGRTIRSLLDELEPSEHEALRELFSAGVLGLEGLPELARLRVG